MRDRNEVRPDLLRFAYFAVFVSIRADNQKMMADPKSGGGGEAASIAAGDSVKKHCAPDGRRRCSGTTKQMTPTPVVVASRDSEVAMIISSCAHAAPRFHEDYYGPSGHEPNHH